MEKIRSLKSIIFISLLSLSLNGCILSDITAALTGAKNSVSEFVGTANNTTNNGGGNNSIDPFAAPAGSTKLVDGSIAFGLDFDNNQAPQAQGKVIIEKLFAINFDDQNSDDENSGDENSNDDEELEVDEEVPEGAPVRLAFYSNNTGRLQTVLNDVISFKVNELSSQTEDLIEYCDFGEGSGTKETKDIRFDIKIEDENSHLIAKVITEKGTCDSPQEETIQTRQCTTLIGSVFTPGRDNIPPLGNEESVFEFLGDNGIEFEFKYALIPGGCDNTPFEFPNYVFIGEPDVNPSPSPSPSYDYSEYYD